MLTLQSCVDQQHMFDFFFFRFNLIYGQKKALPTPASNSTRQDKTIQQKKIYKRLVIHISIKDGTRQLFLIISWVLKAFQGYKKASLLNEFY